MRVFAYCRVSSKAQGDSGLSLESQEARIRAYCVALGFDLAGVFVEVASAASFDRPVLKRAIDSCQLERAGLIVTKLDRLSRRVKDFCAIIDEFKAEGLPLVSVEDSLDTSTPSGLLVANIMMSVAQWERDIISERTRHALDAKKARGEKLGRPAPEASSVAELEAIQAVLHRHYSIRRAATEFGVSRSQLTRWVSEARQ